MSDYKISLIAAKEAESISVSIHDLHKGLSYKEFFSMTVFNNLKYADMVHEYLDMFQVSPERVVSYESIPEFGDSSGNFRFRFLIVKTDDNDLVFCLFKVVDMGRVRGQESYFRVWEPISAKGSAENVKSVLNALAEIDCVKYLIEFDGSAEDYDVNNYYNTRESVKQIFKSSWRSKHGINKLDKILTFRVFRSPEEAEANNLFQQVNFLNQLWERLKNLKSDNKSNIHMLDMLRGREVEFCGTYYRNTLIAFSFCVAIGDKYVAILSSKYLSVASPSQIMNVCHCFEDEAEFIHKKLGYYGVYKVLEYLLRAENFEAAYYYGDMKIKKMRDFKRSVFKKVLYYKFVPLEGR